MSAMLEIKRFEVGSFGTNMYVVGSPSGEALLIDPACQTVTEQQELERYLERCHFHICTIIATHGHLDHLWGAPWACSRFGLPVRMHEADIPMATAMQMQYNLFGIRATAQPFPLEPLNDDTPLLGAIVLHTPGHTPGGICLYWEKEKTLLSGDTLFYRGFGRTDLPGGDMPTLVHSLGRLFLLPADTQVFPGHGEPTIIGEEARFLPHYL